MVFFSEEPESEGSFRKKRTEGAGLCFPFGEGSSGKISSVKKFSERPVREGEVFINPPEQAGEQRDACPSVANEVQRRRDGRGFYYFGARYYAPCMLSMTRRVLLGLCRFTSVDPLAMKFAHLSPYNYAGNKPITQRDIEGLQGENETSSPQSGNPTGGGGGGSGGVGKADNLMPKQAIQVGSVPESIGSSMSNGKISGNEPLPPQTFASDATSAVLQPTSNDLSDINAFAEGVADFLRETPSFDNPIGPESIPNPFYKAEAISVDVGWGLTGSEGDAGSFFMLAGENKGEFHHFKEIAGGIAPEGGVGLEIGRVDISGDQGSVKATDLYGKRDKIWINVNTSEITSAGISGATGESRGETVTTISLQLGVGLSTGISPGVNTGTISPRKK